MELQGVAELLITLTDGRTMRRKLGARPQVIGRDAVCDVSIDDPSTSRRHARLSPTPDGYRVEDLGSKNGTLVNDAPCTSCVLQDGDRIQLGSVVVQYFAADSPPGQSVVISDDVTVSHATRYVSRDKGLELSQQRLEMIYELGGRLTTVQGRNELLEDALSICFETLHFERGAVGVRRQHQRALDWPVVRNLYGTSGELTISRTLLNRALEHGERAIFTDNELGQADPTVSMVQHGIRSAMCVPLVHEDEILGVIYGDRVRTSQSYTGEDIDFMAAIAQQLSIGLINERLVQEQRRMARLNQDIELARTIQRGLFPSALPAGGGLKVAAVNDPGRRVSGDYYDVIERDDGRLWCIVADVTGEGVPAALLMANLQAAVRVTITETDDPSELLARWNRLIYRNTSSSQFITCVLTLVDPGSHQIRFASAGHYPPLLLRPPPHAPEELFIEPAYPLGVVEQTEFPSSDFSAGSEPFALLCYTDGVIEAMNDGGEMFGRDRFYAALAERRDLNPQALVKLVRTSVADFVGGADQSDDITVLAATVG